MALEHPPATAVLRQAAPEAGGRHSRVSRATIALLLLTAIAPVREAFAADRMRVAQHVEPRLTVASTILAEPASLAPFAVQVGPPEALPPNSFIRLRGLPPTVSLTEGHAIAPGSWAVPLIALGTLKANIPAGVSGRSEVIITLVGVDGSLLAEARTALVVGPAAMLAPSQRAGAVVAEPKLGNSLTPPTPVPAGRPDRASTLRPPELSAEDRAHAERMMAQGERYLTQGNIAIARQFFQRAADAGLAQGALRLAATFDPAELDRLEAKGVVPDRAEARKWYERAKELGAPEAEERLARLGGS